MDSHWWRRMARCSGAAPGHRFLDVAAGTGDFLPGPGPARRRSGFHRFHPGDAQRGPDKFRAQGRDRLVWASVGADAQRLPFRDASFDGVTICYGIRNVEDRPRAYREFLRVLKPQGRLTILEFSRPRHRWLRFLYDTYSLRLLPRIGGWISGSPEAYSYLPASIRSFPDQPALAAELAAGVSATRAGPTSPGASWPCTAPANRRSAGAIMGAEIVPLSFSNRFHFFPQRCCHVQARSLHHRGPLSKLPSKKTDLPKAAPCRGEGPLRPAGAPAQSPRSAPAPPRSPRGPGPTRTSNRGK